MDPSKKKTAFETTADLRSIDLFAQAPEDALSGTRLVSAETDPSADRSQAIVELAVDDPLRFVELVSYLPHAIQDIFFQYYFLGRTQTQIGELVGASQTAVWQALRLGTEAICAVIVFGQPPNDRVPEGEMTPLQRRAMEAWRAVNKFATRAENRGELRKREPRTLGQFVLGIDEKTFELSFAPGTTDGPVSRGSAS